ncbi:ABC transporter ATP-binding protein [Ectobacillus sp. sgz5001026]|uniref:ABC transporter ATP-binding protein n=1 Tax=Ectobacillus sp. sgz5001026 TaxID=3242473 RepID=UPI0036D28997
MTVLEITNISKMYKQTTVFHPFSLKVEEGTTIALCGGNGAGKSTCLQMLAGLALPSTGSIHLYDMDVSKQRKQYVSHIGYMPDDFSAQEMLSVEEFLNFYAHFRQVKREEVDELIEKIDLVKQKNMQIKQLSKGMRQRLLLGQAYIGNPTLLLLDEPTNGLDPYWIRMFMKLIKERNQITIFSTHMMDVAAELADIILFLNEGKVTHQFFHSDDKEQMTLQLLKLYRS